MNINSLMNRGGGAEWKKYKGPYKFWIEDAETGETVVEKQVDLFRGEFKFIDVLYKHPYNFALYTPDCLYENYLKEFPNEEWHVSLPINHTYNIKCVYSSNDLISFCKTFPVLDDYGSTLITALDGQYNYFNAYWNDKVFRHNLMYVADNERISAYVLPIDPQMLEYGQYSYDEYPSLQSNIDLIWNIAFEVYVSLETTEIPINVWPIPLCSTFYESQNGFQQYSPYIIITSV